MAVRTVFNLVHKGHARGLLEVSKYVSNRSGLTVTIADVEGPIVNGFLCLATETNTDDGLPHTLEHLIFMGSKRYPYKGLLDLIANRCLANGTNAWTAQDHTCYTVETAGKDGFLNLLPIYLDHILQPMLTEAQFTTEVHHLNGEGEDAGVVYCEMQDQESKMSRMCDRAIKEHMYPEGCGYRVETGGRLLNLRTCCSNSKVCDFHKTYYRMENLNVVVSGTVCHDDVLDVVRSVESSILADLSEKSVSLPQYHKPWRSSIPPLEKSTEVAIPCPSDDVSRGMVSVAWRGPNISKIETLEAISVLMDYLSDTAVSPLEKRFVQIPDPYCSSVDCAVEYYLESYLEVQFEDVPVEKLSEIRPRLTETIEALIDGSDPFDLSRMKDILRQKILRCYSSIETSPHDVVISAIIEDFLYGETGEDFDGRLNDVRILKKLETESEKFWIDLLSEYFGKSKHYVCVVCVPKAEFVEEMTGQEQKRIEQQREKLGPEGLEKCAENLKKAISENDEAQPPEDLLEKCVVNSLEGIKFVKIKSSTNLSPEQDINSAFPLQRLPFTAMLDDCTTNFVKIYAILDTSKLSKEERKFLLLWENLLFESSVMRNGELVPYEEVVKLLNRDLVKYDAHVGLTNSTFLRVTSVMLKVSKEDYIKGVEWLRDILQGVVFDKERMRTVAQKLANSASAEKRDGYTVADFLLNHLSSEKGSNLYLCRILRLEKFHMNLVKELDLDPEKAVSLLTSLHRKMTDPSSIVLHVMCSTENMDLKLETPWTESFGMASSEKAKIHSGKEPFYVDPTGFGRAAIITIGACESAFVLVAVPSIRDRNDPDLPALMLFLQYLDQCEGPLWKEIRGKGLAYGATTRVVPDSGRMFLTLYRTARPVEAYERTRNLIDSFLTGNTSMNPTEFEAAKRSLVFSIIHKEKTVSDASFQSLLSYFRGVPGDHNLQLCKKIWELSSEEVGEIGRKHVPPLFDFTKANVAVTCHPSKLQEICQGFKRLGCELQLLSLEDPLLHEI